MAIMSFKYNKLYNMMGAVLSVVCDSIVMNSTVLRENAVRKINIE